MSSPSVFKYLALSSFGFSLFSHTALAIAPLVVAGAVSAGASIVSTVIDATDELSQTAQAFSELYSEIDSSAAMSEDALKMSDQVQEIESLANDLGYTREQVDEILKTDREGAKKLSHVLMKLSRTVKTASFAAKLIHRLKTRAEVAQIEEAETSKKMLEAQYKIIQQAEERKLEEKKNKLKEALGQKRYLEFKEKQIQAHGGLDFGKVGIYSFPKLSPFLKEALEISKNVQQKLVLLILPLFMAAVGFNSIKLSGADATGKLIQNTLICLFWFMIAPQVVQFIVEISQSLAQEVMSTPTAQGVSSSLQDGSKAPAVSGWMELYSYWSWIYSKIKIALFEIVDFGFSIILCLLIIAFPLVIFISKFIGNGRGFYPFITGLIATALWPLFWNLTGVLALKLGKQDSFLSSANLASVICALFQLVSPYFGYKLLQGSGALEAAGSAVSKMTGAPGQAMSLAEGVAQNPEGNKSAQALSRATQGAKNVGGYLATQVGQRAVSAVKRGREELKNPNRTTLSPISQGARGAISNHGTPLAGNSSLKANLNRIQQGLKPARRIRSPESKA